MSTGSRNRTRHTTTANVRRPTAEKNDRSVIPAVVLTFLVPPLGLYLLWRMDIFRLRGRFVMTFISMAEMICLLMLVLPAQRTPTQQPIPSVPNAATVVPDGEVVDALSNMDQLLADQQAQQAAENTDITPEPTDQAAYQAEQEAILDTVVYSVYGSSAKYYHAVEICGTQTNRRQLTVREAMEEGLGACPNCNPPVYEG